MAFGGLGYARKILLLKSSLLQETRTIERTIYSFREVMTERKLPACKETERLSVRFRREESSPLRTRVLSAASRGPGRARGTAGPSTARAPPVKSSRFKAGPLGGKSFLSLHPRNIRSSRWTHAVRSVTRSRPTLQPHGPQPSRPLCP